MKLLIYKIVKGMSLVVLTFLIWLDFIFDEFIIEFNSSKEKLELLKCGRAMFWESFDNVNIIWNKNGRDYD